MEIGRNGQAVSFTLFCNIILSELFDEMVYSFENVLFTLIFILF